MLAIGNNARCFVCVEPLDFRKGIDGIASVIRQRLVKDPMDGALYLFRNNNGVSIKVLFYDGSAFWLCLRRLSSGRLNWWPKSAENETLVSSLTAREIQVILWNGDPTGAQFPEEWRKLA